MFGDLLSRCGLDDQALSHARAREARHGRVPSVAYPVVCYRGHGDVARLFARADRRGVTEACSDVVGEIQQCSSVSLHPASDGVAGAAGTLEPPLVSRQFSAGAGTELRRHHRRVGRGGHVRGDAGVGGGGVGRRHGDVDRRGGGGVGRHGDVRGDALLVVVDHRGVGRVVGVHRGRGRVGGGAAPEVGSTHYRQNDEQGS